MHSEATARKAASSETATLEYYRVRDETMRAYQPATDEERMLATNIARTWFRLQQYYELESQLLSGRGLLDLFNNDPDRYKLLTRSIPNASGAKPSKCSSRHAAGAKRLRSNRRAAATSPPSGRIALRLRTRRPYPLRPIRGNPNRRPRYRPDRLYPVGRSCCMIRAALETELGPAVV